MGGRAVVLALCMALFLGACGSNGGLGGMGPKQTIGGLGGAALGGYLGSSLGGGKVGVGVGVLLGAILGSEIGRSLDAADKQAAYGSAQHAFEYEPDGGRSTWRNPNTGHSGWTEPTKTWQNPEGVYCREYQTAVVINGQTEGAYGTACRQPDGSWKIQN